MIEIINGKIFIKNDNGEMIQTSNPEQIGLAMLDFVENEGKEIPLKNKIEAYEDVIDLAEGMIEETK